MAIRPFFTTLPTMKFLRYAAAFGLSLTGNALSQSTPPAPPAPEPRPAEAAPRSAVDSQALDYLYNRNPAEGSAAGTARDEARRGKSGAESKQNALESLASSESLLNPDFEKFLSSAESDKDRVAEYRFLYGEALKNLNARKPVEAWQILFALDKFEWDTGLSKQIANRVRAVWDTNTTAKGLLAENGKLEEQIRTANWNADLSADSARRAAESRKKSTKDAPEAAVAAASDAARSGPGTLRMTEEYFKSLDSKARIKLNEVKVDSIKTKARANLVDYITTLYKSRRYAHAVLAAEFYHALFVDGELPPEVANQATASLAATRDIAKGVEAFQFKVQQKQIATASTILEKAWAIGDTTPEMLALDRQEKLAVIDHANRVRRMRNLIEARDFDRLETVLNEMDEKAVDFDTTKPRSLIQAIKLDSKMRLGKARLAVQQGDTQKAMEEFKAAAETWPGNPELDKASSEYFTASDSTTKGTSDFDREIKAGNFRGIAEKQVQYLAFLQSDELRKKQFEQALTRVRDAEAALEKARMLNANGDSAGAWETVQIATIAWPEDSKLNQALGSYASAAPEFVSAINKAQAAEKDKKLGASMSLFALAKGKYPGSQLAGDGLKRVSGTMLNPPEEKKEKAEDAAPSPSPGEAAAKSS